MKPCSHTEFTVTENTLSIYFFPSGLLTVTTPEFSDTGKIYNEK